MSLSFERGQLQRHFGSDQSVWRDGDWNGFVRIALAGLLAPLIELAQSVSTLCQNARNDNLGLTEIVNGKTCNRRSDLPLHNFENVL